MDDANKIELPFGSEMLVPFIVAWRSSSCELSEEHRAARASEILREWGFQLPAKELLIIVHIYQNIFRLDAAILPKPKHEQLVPDDRECCICRAKLTSYMHGSRTLDGGVPVTLWSLSAAPQTCVSSRSIRSA